MKSLNEAEGPSGRPITRERLTDELIEVYEFSLSVGDTGTAVDAIYGIMELNGIPKDNAVMQEHIAATLAGLD
jgi:hypothetical protein